MNTFDLSPLFRSTIGFDRLMRAADAATRADSATLSYPPYDIEVTGEDSYRLTMAVAGFCEEDLEITLRENALVIAGKARKEEGKQYLHHGIARRAFERRFQIADHIKVMGARLDNGMLHIDLVREIPESARSRTIPVSTASRIEGREAA